MQLNDWCINVNIIYFNLYFCYLVTYDARLFVYSSAVLTGLSYFYWTFLCNIFTSTQYEFSTLRLWHCNEMHKAVAAHLSLIFVQVQENSPGHRAGLEPFFDFIVSINNTRLVKEATGCIQSEQGLKKKFVSWLNFGSPFPSFSPEQGQWHLERLAQSQCWETS